MEKSRILQLKTTGYDLVDGHIKEKEFTFEPKSMDNLKAEFGDYSINKKCQGNYVSNEVARKLITDFNKGREKLLSNYENKGICFSADLIRTLLSQDGATGLKIYLSTSSSEKDKVSAVLVPCDKNGYDLLGLDKNVRNPDSGTYSINDGQTGRP